MSRDKIGTSWIQSHYQSRNETSSYTHGSSNFCLSKMEYHIRRNKYNIQGAEFYQNYNKKIKLSDIIKDLLGDSAIVESPDVKDINECKLPLIFYLSCKCWLYQYINNLVAIFISLVHSHWFYKSPFFVIFWIISFNFSFTFDTMLELATFLEKNLQKYLE